MDVSQYLDIFIDETNGHIQTLNDNIMILEKEPENKDVINEIFSPSEQEIENARGIVATLEEAIAAGRGACMYQGKMIDAPIAERAHRILIKANLIAAKESAE